MPSSEVHQFLDPMFNEIKDGVCVSTGGAGLIYMNPAAAKILGVDAEESLGASVCDLLCAKLASPDRGAECRSTCPLRGRVSKFATFQGRFGPRPAFQWSAGHLEHGDDAFSDLRVHCQLLETTLFDSWEPEKWLTIIEDAGPALELERMKEDWRNMVAHDLRSPLTNVFGTLRILEEGLDKFSAEEKNLLATAVRGCRRMLDLLNLYLDVAKLDAGQMPVKPSNVDLTELVSSVAKEQQPALRAKKARLAVDVAPGLKARADEGLLFRVVQNLLANAIKFAPEGGSIELKGRLEDGRVALSVTDDGPGIAPQDLRFLFERYFQTAAGQGRNMQGTGLGLTFCRRALRSMGGEISVSSQPGKGSTFTVALAAVA